MNKISNIIPGTKYQFDLKDLAFIGKNDQGIVLSYKQGLQVQITITTIEDVERQYKDICDRQKEYNEQTHEL